MTHEHLEFDGLKHYDEKIKSVIRENSIKSVTGTPADYVTFDDKGNMIAKKFPIRAGVETIVDIITTSGT